MRGMIVALLLLATSCGSPSDEVVFETTVGEGWRILSTGVSGEFSGFVTTGAGLEHVAETTDAGAALAGVDITEEIVVAIRRPTSCEGRTMVLGIDMTGPEFSWHTETDTSFWDRFDRDLFNECATFDGRATVVAFDRDVVPDRFTFEGMAVSLTPEDEAAQHLMLPRIDVDVAVASTGGIQPVVRNLWFQQHDKVNQQAKTYLIGEVHTDAGGVQATGDVEVVGFLADCHDTATCKAATPAAEPCRWTHDAQPYERFHLTVRFDHPGCQIQIG